MAREAPLLPVAKRYLAGMATTFACLVAHIALTPSLAAGDGAQSQSLSRHSFLACMPLVLAAVAAIIVIAYRAAMKFDRAFKLQDLANPVRGLLAPFKRADSDLEAALRREQANHIGTQLNVLMAINIANLCLVTAMIWQSVDTTLLAVWFAVVLLMAVMGIAARMKARGRADFMTSPVSKRTLRRITLHSGFRGVMWGLCFSLFFASVGPAGQLILLSVSLGMLAGGIPALAPVPSAALLFGLGIVLPTVLRLVAMGGTDHFVLAMFGLAFSGSMVMVGVQLYRNFAVNLLAQRAQAEQAATISLLLNEFENSASDWLWETDRDGGLVRAPERMLDILGSAVAGSIGWTLDAALTRPGCGGQSSIGRAMQSGTAFRDVIVQSVDVAGQDRWIAFTASPRAGGGYRGVGSEGVLWAARAFLRGTGRFEVACDVRGAVYTASRDPGGGNANEASSRTSTRAAPGLANCAAPVVAYEPMNVAAPAIGSYQ